MITLQEVCDKVAEKMVEQGRPCVDMAGECVYSNHKGEHCAIGWVLVILGVPSDSEFYEVIGGLDTLIEEMRNSAVEDDASKEEKDAMYFIGYHRKAMRVLQDFHDTRKDDREDATKHLDKYIDTSNPNWKLWSDAKC